MTDSDYLKRPDAQGHLHVMKMLRKWDPIGVIDDFENPDPCCADEYDSYSGPIVRMLDEGIQAKELAVHLARIRSEQMGLTPNPTKDLAIASELVEWWMLWKASGRGRSSPR